MKKDTGVKLSLRERRKGTSQQLAAHVSISKRKGRSYERQGEPPTQLVKPPRSL